MSDMYKYCITVKAGGIMADKLGKGEKNHKYETDKE